MVCDFTTFIWKGSILKDKSIHQRWSSKSYKNIQRRYYWEKQYHYKKLCHQ